MADTWRSLPQSGNLSAHRLSLRPYLAPKRCVRVVRRVVYYWLAAAFDSGGVSLLDESFACLLPAIGSRHKVSYGT
eukprot:5934328-Amphidinium_carterae.1